MITHTTLAYFLTRPQRFKSFRIFFYLGTILPDLLSRPWYIIFPKLYFYSIAIHTPVFMIVFSLLAIEFFPPFQRKSVFIYLMSGILAHFALDLLQKHLVTGYYWFFPFSWHSFEIGLFWPETAVNLIPLWIIAVVFTELVILVWKTRESAT